jgi:hypothetical protein
VLCQLDDDSLGAADVAEPVAVLVALQLADELSAAGSQAGDDGVDVFDGECYMADARCVRRLVPVAALGRRRVEFRQLKSSVAVRGLQERDLRPDAVEPHDAVHPAALDRGPSLQLESKFDEELGCGREVVNHYADVLHPLDRHVLYGNESRFEPQSQAPEGTRSSTQSSSRPKNAISITRARTPQQRATNHYKMPRRYHAYPPEFQVLNVLSTAGASILAIGYLLPAIYLLWSLKYGKTAGANPWRATGLEWKVQSPPLTDNFLEIPLVSEEAYDYDQIGNRVEVMG